MYGLITLQHLCAMSGIGIGATFAIPFIKTFFNKKQVDVIPWDKLGLTCNEQEPLLISSNDDVLTYHVPVGMSVKTIREKKDLIENILKYPISITHDNNYNMIIKRINTRYKDKYTIDLKENILPCLKFHLGKTINGNNVYLDLSKNNPMSMIAGLTGSGKSCCLNLLITQMILQQSYDIYVIDYKQGVEYTLYRDYIVDLATDDKSSLDLTNHLCNIMDMRYKEIAKQGLKRYTGKPIVLFIDEFAEIDKKADNYKGIYNNIDRLLRLSRACNIYCVLCTQYPSTDIIDNKLRRNISNFVIFGESDINVADIMDINKSVGKPSGVGFLKSLGKTIEFKGFYLNDNEIKRLLKSVPKRNKEVKKDVIIPTTVTVENKPIKTKINTKVQNNGNIDEW